MDIADWIKGVNDGRPRSPQVTNPQDICDHIWHPAWQCGSFPVTFQERTFLLFQWASRQLNIVNFNNRGSRDDILTFAEALVEYGKDILVDTHKEMEENMEKGNVVVCDCHDPANAEHYANWNLRSCREGRRLERHCLADIVTGASHQSSSHDSIDSEDSVVSLKATATKGPPCADTGPVLLEDERASESPNQGIVQATSGINHSTARVSDFRSAATIANMASMHRSAVNGDATVSAIGHVSPTGEGPLFLSPSSDDTEEDQLLDSSPRPNCDETTSDIDNDATEVRSCSASVFMVPVKTERGSRAVSSSIERLLPSPLAGRSLNMDTAPLPRNLRYEQSRIKRQHREEDLPSRSGPLTSHKRYKR
ncbi:hypothetical protein A4X13_0g459 [Tilletia indica]|uniref:Uncharacterized protein n=1 Tax=Tilletia indica TaxID=43049 RepID=A0A177TI08_9BASI|nr:hypothetical protein A4X13_0g459 [Tilletia indica]